MSCPQRPRLLLRGELRLSLLRPLNDLLEPRGGDLPGLLAHLAVHLQEVGLIEVHEPLRHTDSEFRPLLWGMCAAETEARANDWNLTIFVADAEGAPLYLRRMDGASPRTTDIVMRKVHVVITTGGTSGAYGEALAAGTVDSIPGGIHYEGGLPIFVDGEFVGAMAASGARGSEDAQAVRAGLAAIGATSESGM